MKMCRQPLLFGNVNVSHAKYLCYTTKCIPCKCMEVFFLPKLVSAFLSEAGPRRLGAERERQTERETETES
jgi:hypothetical protein